MNKIYLLIAAVVLFVGIALFAGTKLPDKKNYLSVGIANPGNIVLYEVKNGEEKEVKKIDTGYKFVWTVRTGDIFNNNKQYLIAGVSDSFYGKEYGCKVIGYSLDDFKPFIIDSLKDLRCKDLTIGDADNDGKNDILLVTHGEGIVRLYTWNGSDWKIEDIEKNFIAEIDRAENTNHRVSADKLPCKDCIVQTAVHIVQVGDVDNDGENEVVVSISSPLELLDVQEISYVKVFKKQNNTWKETIVDKLVDTEARSITIGDIFNNKKNALLIGTGSQRGVPATLYAYEFKNDKWDKKQVYADPTEKNMKAVDLGDIYKDGVQRIFLTTGFPAAKVMVITWDGTVFSREELGTVASFYPESDGEYNAMAVTVVGDSKKPTVYIGGMITYPKKKIGFEASSDGFFLKMEKSSDNWSHTKILKNNVIAVDLP